MKLNKNKLHFIRVTILLVGFIFSVNPAYSAKAGLDDNIKSPSSSTPFFDMYLKAYGGEMFNYNSYDVTSPLAGITAWFKLYFNKDRAKYQYVTYKVNGEKLFTNVSKTINTLDSITNRLKVRFGSRNGDLHTGINVSYDWVIKPSWPDLYQPNPRVYTAGSNQQISYDSTDRYSYHKLGVDYTWARPIKNNRSLYWNAGIFRKFGYEDPNYDLAVPTRLAPDVYTGIKGRIGVKDTDDQRPVGREFSNTIEFRYYDSKLARDAVTGFTNYLSNPNPNYMLINDKTVYMLEFRIPKSSMTIKPYGVLELNIDPYAHYYSFVGGKVGFILNQKIFAEKVEYKVKASFEYQQFGASAYGTSATHPPLTDGTYLYKMYVDAGLEINYMFSQSFEYFIEGGLSIKRTNYPSYVPGVNPVSGRNYDIDFSFNNYSVRSGFTYRL